MSNSSKLDYGDRVEVSGGFVGEEQRRIFQRLNDELGIRLVLVTHEPDISLFARRVIRFRDGKLVEDRPVVNRRTPPEATGKPS